MLAHVGDPDAEVAAALVDVERSRLENRLVAGLVLIIEVGECHIIVQESKQVTVIVDELVDLLDALCIVLFGVVLLHEGEEFVLPAVGDDIRKIRKVNAFHLRAFLVGEPLVVCAKFCSDGVPFRFCNRLFSSKVNVQNKRLQRLELAFPRGIHRLVERKFCLSVDSCKRISLYFGDCVSEVFLRNLRKAVLGDFERGSGVGIQRSELAADEIVCDLILDGVICVACSGGAVAVGYQGCVVYREVFPSGEVGGFGVKFLNQLLGDAVGAASVGRLADVGDDSRNDFFLGNHAVTVVLGVGKNLHAVGCFANGDFVLVGEFEVGEYLTRRIEEFFALVGVVTYVRKGHHGRFCRKGLQRFEHLLEPLYCRRHLVDLDVSVAVGIKHLECLRVNLEPCGGAAEYSPLLLVELRQVCDVVAGLEAEALLRVGDGQDADAGALAHVEAPGERREVAALAGDGVEVALADGLAVAVVADVLNAGDAALDHQELVGGLPQGEVHLRVAAVVVLPLLDQVGTGGSEAQVHQLGGDGVVVGLAAVADQLDLLLAEPLGQLAGGAGAVGEVVVAVGPDVVLAGVDEHHVALFDDAVKLHQMYGP